jgi:hypothetical protein
MVESAKATKKDIQWTDDEAELLLYTTHLYKVKKETKLEDWESEKSKRHTVVALTSLYQLWLEGQNTISFSSNRNNNYVIDFVNVNFCQNHYICIKFFR